MPNSVTDTAVLHKNWQELIKSLPGLVYRLNADADDHFTFSFISPVVTQWFGVEPESLITDASPVINRIHPEDIEETLATSEAAARNGAHWHHEFRMFNKDGNLIWLEAYDRGELMPDGSRVWTGYLNDITERKELERKLAESESLFRNIVENANDIIYTLSPEGKFLYLSPNWYAQLGYDVQASLTDNFERFVHVDDIARCRDFLSQVVTNPKCKVPPVEYRVIAADGSIQWHTSVGAAVCDDKGTVQYYLGIARDVTESKQANDKLAQLARYDLLTGLPNRAYFQELLDHELQSVSAMNQTIAVLFIDLDKFKPVNDLYGHDIGDELLKIVAQRIQRSLRDGDYAGRLGGDEFTVILTKLSVGAHDVSQEVVHVAERIREALDKPVSVRELTLQVSASIGAAIYPLHAKQLGELMRAADQAMYQAKANGRNCVHLLASNVS